jgi:hypothetical protein
VFRWACLLVAVAFLAAVAWMVNDMRLAFRQTCETINKSGATIEATNKLLPEVVEAFTKAGATIEATNKHLPEVVEAFTKAGASVDTVNKHLPSIMENTQKATTSVGDDLPDIVQKSRAFADTASSATKDIEQLKKALAKMKADRDPALVAYANEILALVEGSGAVIGQRPLTGFGGLKSPIPAREWVLNAQQEASVLVLLTKSRADLAARLTSNVLGSPYVMQFPDGKRIAILDWLKANHPTTRELFK